MSMEITLGDVFRLLSRLEEKVDRIANEGPRFVSRPEIIRQIGINNYDHGVDVGFLSEIKGPGRNSKILIERSQYEYYLSTLKR